MQPQLGTTFFTGKAMMDFGYENMQWGKILSRRSSIGCSSRISYYRSGEGVPFKWEMQPGIAKEQQPREDDLPPLNPPPALLSLGLPKPCIPDTKPSTGSRLRFWKKRVKRGKSIKSSHDCFHEDDDDDISLDILARLDCSSDSESVASSRGSSFSSWSSMSFVKSPTTIIKKVYGRPLTSCFPMHVSRVFISIGRSG